MPSQRARILVLSRCLLHGLYRRCGGIRKCLEIPRSRSQVRRRGIFIPSHMAFFLIRIPLAILEIGFGQYLLTRGWCLWLPSPLFTQRQVESVKVHPSLLNALLVLTRLTPCLCLCSSHSRTGLLPWDVASCLTFTMSS